MDLCLPLTLDCESPCLTVHVNPNAAVCCTPGSSASVGAGGKVPVCSGTCGRAWCWQSKYIAFMHLQAFHYTLLVSAYGRGGNTSHMFQVSEENAVVQYVKAASHASFRRSGSKSIIHHDACVNRLNCRSSKPPSDSFIVAVIH